MLDLSSSTRTVNGVTIAPDSELPSTFYVVPVGARPAPGPDLHLLRYVNNGQLTGGYLRLAMDCGVDDAALAAATATLSADVGKPVTLSPLPLIEAEADLVFYGRHDATPGAATPFVLDRYGSSPLELNSPHRGVFALSLTADGVQLVEAGLRSGQLPVGVTCRLTVEGLWPAAPVTARVDWRSVYDHFSTSYRMGALLFADDVNQLMQSLQQNSAVQVSVIESPVAGAAAGSTDAVIANALAFVQNVLLAQFCRPVMPLQTDPAHATLGDAAALLNLGAAFEVVALTQIENTQACFDFSEATVARRVLTAQSTLGNLLGGQDPAGFISDAGVDDPFFKQFHLDCRTASPLADLHLSEVLLDVAYGSASGSIRLTPPAPTGGFDCYADASADGSWTITPRATFAADSPVDPNVVVALPAFTGNTRDLTLDLGRLLGLARFDVLGPADPRVVATAATVARSASGVARGQVQLSLTPGAPQASAWFRDQQPDDVVTVSGVHLLDDGRQVPIVPATIDTALFRLPNPFAGSITVQLVTDPVWTDLSQVVVAIGKDASAPTKTFSFTAPGAAAVALDQPDPTDRTYRYQVSRVVAGVNSTDPWLVSDAPLLAVGRVSAGDLVVDVEPVGPELTVAGLRQLAVDLLYVDVAHQLRAEHTVVIAAKADAYRWEVHLADPTLRTYQFRITKILLTGESHPGAWTDSSDPVLPIPITAS